MSTEGITVDGFPALPSTTLEAISDLKLYGVLNETDYYVTGDKLVELIAQGFISQSDLIPLATKVELASATHEILRANRTFYVRKDGNDSHTGLVDNATGAFLTIQRAVDVASRFDFNESRSFTITIQIGAGIYEESIILTPLINIFNLTYQSLRPIEIIGNETNPETVVIKPIGGDSGFLASGVSCCYYLKGLTIDLTTSVDWASAIECCNGSSIHADNLKFVFASGNYGVWLYGKSNFRYWTYNGDCTISGNAYTFFLIAEGSFVDFEPARLVFVGPTSFSNAFVEIYNNSLLYYYGGVKVGTATGIKFKAGSNSSIVTWGSGLSEIAGSIAGTFTGNATYS